MEKVVKTGTVKMFYGCGTFTQKVKITEVTKMYQGSAKRRYHFFVQEINKPVFIKMASGPSLEGLVRFLRNTTVNMIEICFE